MIHSDSSSSQIPVNQAATYFNSIQADHAEFNRNINKLAEETPKVKVLSVLFKSARAVKLTSFANYISSAKNEEKLKALTHIRGKPVNDKILKSLDASYRAANNNLIATDTENEFKAKGFGNIPKNLQARNVQNGPPPTETERKEKNRLNERLPSENNERIAPDNQSKEKNRIHIVIQDSNNVGNDPANLSKVATPRTPRIDVANLAETLKSTKETIEWIRHKLSANPTGRQGIDINGVQYWVSKQNNGALYIEREKIDESGLPTIEHTFTEKEFIKNIGNEYLQFSGATEEEIDDYQSYIVNDNLEGLEKKLGAEFSQHPTDEAIEKVFAPDNPEADLDLLLETLDKPTDRELDDLLHDFSVSQNNNNAGVQQATENDYATQHAEMDKLLSAKDQHIKSEDLDKATEEAMQSLNEPTEVRNQNSNQAFDLNSGQWVSLHENIESVSTNILHPIK